MKYNIKILLLLNIFIMILTSCPDPASENIILDPAILEIEVNSSITLSVQSLPAGSKLPGITWASLNEAIASVNQQGTVTGLSPGQTQITATSQTNTAISAACQVTVIPSVSKVDVELTRDTVYNVDTSGYTTVWYYFTASAGSTYIIEWMDKGLGGYTADLLVSAYKSDKQTPFYENSDTGFMEITSADCERICIKVEQQQTGSYALKYRFNNTQVPATWTLMLYLNCNDLEDSVIANIKEMQDGYHPNTRINVVMLIDKETTATYSLPVLNFSGAGLFICNTDGLSRMGGGNEFPEIAASGNQEINMGSAAILKKYIDFCKANFPASRFGLILMAHGLGTGGFSADDELGGRLHCGEIKEVLTAAQSVNLLGFNSCLMGNVETAYQFRNDSSNPGFKADVMLAPPGTTHILGWDYASVFTRIDISKGGTNSFIRLPV